jgi:hypothetical protein
MIVHYHFYKNAGSSVERALSDIFRESLLRFDDFSSPNNIYYAENLSCALKLLPEVRAVTSHQLVPLPLINWFPILFIRDPIIRSYSVFRYERDRGMFGGDITYPEFVRSRISSDNDFSISNFQALKLSGDISNISCNSDVIDENELIARSKVGLRNFQFVGRVEAFSESMRIYSELASDLLDGQRLGVYEENLSGAIKAAPEMRKYIIDLLDEDLSRMLLDRNLLDIELYDFVKDLFPII